jgi:hypothetical protein
LFDLAVVKTAVDLPAARAGTGLVLELGIGIGTGRLALPISRRGLRIHGIQLSHDMVEELRRHRLGRRRSTGRRVAVGDAKREARIIEAVATSAAVHPQQLDLDRLDYSSRMSPWYARGTDRSQSVRVGRPTVNNSCSQEAPLARFRQTGGGISALPADGQEPQCERYVDIFIGLWSR